MIPNRELPILCTSRFSLAAAALLSLFAPRPGAAQAPRLSLVTQIGCEACDGPTQFGAILDLAVDDSGSILVIADEAPILRRFSPSGRMLWSSGTTGSGPGELRRPMRGMLGPGLIQVLDMSLRRVTRFDPFGAYRSSASLRGFPAAVSAQGRTGAFLILLDDFRGGLKLERWTARDSGSAGIALPPPAEPRTPGTIVFPSIAVSVSGDVALARDGNLYRIEVVGPDGAIRRTLARDVPQVKRTAAEREAQERISARAAARVNAERGGSGRPAGPTPRPGGDPDLKPHISIDGLRYDDAGRLWVKTMRGDQSATIFDVFSASGQFLGEVRVDGSVGRYAHAGPWLAVATDTEEGYPVVRVYRVQ